MINIKNFSIKTTIYESESFSLYQIVDKTNDNKTYISKVIKRQITDQDRLIKEIEFFLSLNHPSFLTFFGFSPTDFENNPYLTIICEDLSYIPYKKLSESDEYTDEMKSRLFLVCLSLFNYFKIRHSLLLTFSMNEFFFNPHQIFFPHVIFLSFEFCPTSKIENCEKKFEDNLKQELKLNEVKEIKDDAFKKSIYLFLNEEDQRDIQLAIDGNIEKCLLIGKNFLNGENNFPKNEDEAIQFLKWAADAGNTEAQVLLMSLLSDDPSMQKEAFKYCMLASKSGDFGAISNLGVFLLEGKQIKQNLQSAADCFKVAAEHGVIQAIMNYAYCLSAGVGVEKDDQKALKFWKNAADRGVVQAMLNYAEKTDDREETVKYYEKAGELGCSEAFDRLGDVTKNVEYYKKAADLGNVKSATKFAYYKAKNDEKEEALKYFEIAAKNNDSTAIYNYQILLFELNKADQISLEKVVEYYRKSIEKGDIQSMLNLAELFEEGNEFVKKDVNEAFKLFQLASDSGNSEGSLNCGRILEEYKSDIIGAISFYKLAMERENADAFVCLARCLDQIGGDSGVIVDLLEKAVEYEDAEGMFMLGMLRAEGKHVDKNIDEAKRLLALADENGYETDSPSIQEIIENL